MVSQIGWPLRFLCCTICKTLCDHWWLCPRMYTVHIYKPSHYIKRQYTKNYVNSKNDDIWACATTVQTVRLRVSVRFFFLSCIFLFLFPRWIEMGSTDAIENVRYQYDYVRGNTYMFLNRATLTNVIKKSQ